MNEEKIVKVSKVTIEVPTPIHRLIMKLAAVEGSDVSEWYTHAITRDAEALLGDAHDVFDVCRVIKSNGLHGIITVEP